MIKATRIYFYECKIIQRDVLILTVRWIKATHLLYSIREVGIIMRVNKIIIRAYLLLLLISSMHNIYISYFELYKNSFFLTMLYFFYLNYERDKKIYPHDEATVSVSLHGNLCFHAITIKRNCCFCVFTNKYTTSLRIFITSTYV